ncbi:type II TA system antitoxin MqsA family protein [Polaromonas sp.]|uniref:type II TA system antitoxin MqsA family protein n=1 Tax=Polaromonas sp. TaxID=1869339 RepID=UPI00356AFC61
MKHACVFCDSPEVAEVVYDEKVTAGRRKVSVVGLKKMECPSCGHEYVEPEQLALNQAIIESATTEPGQVVVGLLRNLRDRWELTQRTASNLFGAGQNSFAKWESGQLPSGPTALLLQCAMSVPGVMEYLARLNKATLPSCPELIDWEDGAGEVTGQLAITLPPEKPTRPSLTWVRLGSPPLDYKPSVVELYGEAA